MFIPVITKPNECCLKTVTCKQIAVRQRFLVTVTHLLHCDKLINKLAIVKKHSKIDYENEPTIICDLFRQGSQLLNSTCTLSPGHLPPYLLTVSEPCL